MRFVIDILPMGAVRMTKNGKWTSGAAQRYLTYKEHLKYAVRNQMAQGEKFEQGEALHVELVFKMPVPPSSSLKIAKELLFENHVKKPDIDNLIKSVFDSINGICWHDDNQVSSVTATKYYSPVPGIEIIIESIEGA